MLEREPIASICSYNFFVTKIIDTLKKHDLELLCPTTPRIVRESKNLRFQIESNGSMSIYLDDVAIVRELVTNSILDTFRLGVSNALRHLLFSLGAALQTSLEYQQYVESVIEKGFWEGIYQPTLRKQAEYRYKSITLTRESSHEVTFTLKGDTDSHVNGIVFNTILLGD